MDKHSEERLAELYPPLAEKIRRLANLLSADGVEIRVTQGLRTWPEQQRLYEQGRTQPGKIVTNAQAGESWHNLGLACDCAPFVDGIPDWNEKHPIWQKIVQVGESLGLRSGIAWRDEPHFEMTGEWGTKPGHEALYLMKDGGIRAVWDGLDRQGGIVA